MARTMLTPQLREDAEAIITAFISSKAKDADVAGAVVGMSGGLDSSVIANLCARALGKDRVMGVMIPDDQSDPQDLEHAIPVIKSLGMEHRVVDITESVTAFGKILPRSDMRLPLANLRARARMIILYYIANATNRLVFGCSNKTELMIGYFTKFGDGGADYLPIGDLYKTQVREIARRLKVPESILSKAPSAGLWKGQTDENELAIPYELLDQILFGLEMQMSTEDIVKRIECNPETVKKIRNKVQRSTHKRRMPLIPKIGLKTPAFDWREF